MESNGGAKARALAAGVCLCACCVAPHLLLEERIQVHNDDGISGRMVSMVLYFGSSRVFCYFEASAVLCEDVQLQYWQCSSRFRSSGLVPDQAISGPAWLFRQQFMFHLNVDGLLDNLESKSSETAMRSKTLYCYWKWRRPMKAGHRDLGYCWNDVTEQYLLVSSTASY